MRISAWSSDVCSSDLANPSGHTIAKQPLAAEAVQRLLETAGMALLGLGERFEPVGDFVEAFIARGARHAWIHVRVFVGFARDGRLEVLVGGADGLDRERVG